MQKSRSVPRTLCARVTVVSLVGDDDRNIVAGSYAVSGSFTHEAWDDGYVKDAIKNAATNELQTTDWVLKTATFRRL